MRLKFLWILICSIFFLQSHVFSSEKIKEILSNIPVQDQKILTLFFRRLFYRGDFSYTLLGAKPLGLIDYNLQLLLNPKVQEKQKRIMVLDRMGWEVWKKYAHLFPSKRFCFIDRTISKEDHFFGFCLIDKFHCIQIISKHLDLFLAFLNRKATPQEILSLLCNGKLFPDKVDMYNKLYHKALGVLLGYESQSIEDFSEKIRIEKSLIYLPISPNAFPKHMMNDVKNFILNARFVSSHDHVEFPTIGTWIRLHTSQYLLKMTHRNHPLFPVQVPGFIVSKNNSETHKLIKDYDKIKQKVRNMYYSEDFLIQVLEALVS